MRISGLRIHGPSTSSDGDTQPGRGILADSHVFKRTIVDHNEIFSWPDHAVDVWGDREASEICRDHRDPRETRTIQVRVVRNFIHDNRKQNAGYGVEAHYGGYPLVAGNTFVSNRHAIMADGKACTSYLAWYNLVLSEAPWQRKLGVPLWHTHDFDTHGTGDNGFGGRAGQFFEIARNTFLGRNRHNYELRGNPARGVEFHHNISMQDSGDAVHCDDCGASEKIKVGEGNVWNSRDPTLSLGVGDFDADGRDDLFLATGAAWYYSSAGAFEWRFLSAQTQTMDTIRFGDFDADGRTDVFTQQGRTWLVSWAGASRLERLGDATAPMADVHVADFDGDGYADVFHADGQRWWVTYRGTTPRRHTQDSGFRVADLRFGDMNRDGRTDVVGVVGGRFAASLSATGSWSDWPMAETGVEMSQVSIADLDGDRHADIVMTTEPRPRPPGDRNVILPEDPRHQRTSMRDTRDWYLLPAGKGPSRLLYTTPMAVAAVGRFDERRGADLLFWDGDFMKISSSGSAAIEWYGRRFMR